VESHCRRRHAWCLERDAGQQSMRFDGTTGISKSRRPLRHRLAGGGDRIWLTSSQRFRIYVHLRTAKVTKMPRWNDTAWRCLCAAHPCTFSGYAFCKFGEYAPAPGHSAGLDDKLNGGSAVAKFHLKSPAGGRQSTAGISPRRCERCSDSRTWYYAATQIFSDLFTVVEWIIRQPWK
jgi:hypothetical protein